MAKAISLNEVKRRSGVSYPSLLKYRDRMLFRCPDKTDAWCGPLAKFVASDKPLRFYAAAIPLFLREKRAGLAKRGRPPVPAKGRG